jgi:hypothetical protein
MKIGYGLALAALLWAPVGCKHKRPNAAQDAARIATMVHMNDPRAVGQLLSGFYDIEDGSWRWTGKQFLVELATPLGAGGRGATLELQLTVPPIVIERNQGVTVSASVDGNVLPPETYTKAGEYLYKRDVPASLLAKDTVKVAFEVDKTLPPGGVDARELGVIATTVGLVRK